MTDFNKFSFTRVGAVSPSIEIGNPILNANKILENIKKAKEIGVEILVFPELCITGYTCADLFGQRFLLDKAKEALSIILKATKDINMIIALGMPLAHDNQLFNCGVTIYKGEILGAVPKTYIPSYNEFYEKRWFSSAQTSVSRKIKICNQEVPFGTDILFKDNNSELCIAVEICEDLWMPNPPSSTYAVYGANIILNLSASNEFVGKYDYRKNLVISQSAKTMSAYIFTSAGQTESTTDLVFSGHLIIAENGALCAENIFEDDSITYYDIDVEKLQNDRRKYNSFVIDIKEDKHITVGFNLERESKEELYRNIDPHPFVPSHKKQRDERCSEIFTIQSVGLTQRLKRIGIKKVVLGISGGLDSTLALLVCTEAMKRLDVSNKNILGITMPGFGTTDRTYNNAVTLMKELGVDYREIPIKEACLQHFKDIGHDPNKHDVTYENVQARERTQVLMDIANKEGAIVIGTGDLSEFALGWTTFNGDHMSMYGVNTSIPKTLVRYLIEWRSQNTENINAKAILKDILDTPVSPELLPPDNEGRIQQKTENIIGPYELHDFFLYNMLRNGYSPEKVYILASIAFSQKYNKDEILIRINEFYKRFITQQFKRSSLPDGPKVGSVSLSPRGDLRLPSDADYRMWQL